MLWSATATPPQAKRFEVISMSVRATGSTLHKGEEFGYFSFGGSDIVTLFEPNRVELTAKIDTHYNQGRQIGCAM